MHTNNKRKIVTVILFVFGLFFIRYIISFFFSKRNNEEFFDILNEDGDTVSRAPRSVCHNGSKLLHPVVHIHFYSKDGKLLLQKRSRKKDIQPGKWDTSVGGHVSSGESVNSGFMREALEECGIIIDSTKLEQLNPYIYESHIEREMVYPAFYHAEGPFVMQKSEIDELKFFSLKQVQQLVNAGETTSNFAYEFDKFIRKSGKIR